MKWRIVARETDIILAIADLDTPFARSIRISSSFPSSFDFPNTPLGLPIIFPFAFAATNPSFVRSEIKSRSISANSPGVGEERTVSVGLHFESFWKLLEFAREIKRKAVNYAWTFKVPRSVAPDRRVAPRPDAIQAQAGAVYHTFFFSGLTCESSKESGIFLLFLEFFYERF